MLILREDDDLWNTFSDPSHLLYVFFLCRFCFISTSVSPWRNNNHFLICPPLQNEDDRIHHAFLSIESHSNICHFYYSTDYFSVIHLQKFVKTITRFFHFVSLASCECQILKKNNFLYYMSHKFHLSLSDVKYNCPFLFILSLKLSCGLFLIEWYSQHHL